MEFLGFVIVIALIVIPVWAFVRTFTVESRLKREFAIEIARLEKQIRDMRAVTAAAPAPAPAPVPAPADEPVDVPIREIAAEAITETAVEPAEKIPAVAAIQAERISLMAKWRAQFAAFSKSVDWEQFTGVKLFAWLGAIALFCGAGFFVKFSIDNDLISPPVRLALGALAGLVLVAWSLIIDRKKYRVTSLILASGAIGVLYAVAYATATVYHYIPDLAGSLLLVLISASAFVLAVCMNGVSISALGAVGAFAVPLLINPGELDIRALFTYLALVDAGLYAVVRRLKSAPLFLLGAAGTLFLLFLAILDSGLGDSSWAVTGTGMAALALFSAFLVFMPPDLAREKEIRAAGFSLYAAALALMLALIPEGGVYTMAFAVYALSLALALGYFRRDWHSLSLPFSALTFLAVIFWVLRGFGPEPGPLHFMLFFAYGLAGGLGPFLLAGKYGLKPFDLGWFRVFPLVLVSVTAAMLLLDPAAPVMFWPMVLGIDGLAFFLCLVAGSAGGLAAISAITLFNAIFWIFHSPAAVDGISFYSFLTGAAIILCAGTFIVLRYLPALLKTGPFEPFAASRSSLEGSRAEWLAAFPAMGLFAILGTAYLVRSPVVPEPGMAAGLLFLVLALILGSRMSSVPLVLVSLFSFVAAQACWMLPLSAGSPGLPSMFVWSAVLWAASLTVPLQFIRPIARHAPVWQGWAAFELSQALFLVRAATLTQGRAVSGWIAAALFLLKLPAILYLLKSLEGEKERNRILAFHGGAVLFYASAVAVLLLHGEWLGLALVFEATGLLWLNRRVEHPGLPLASVCLAPAGLVLLASKIDVLKDASDLPLLNPAFASLAFAVLALVVSIFLAPKKSAERKALPYATLFMWLAGVTGFFLVNFLVGDFFPSAAVSPGTDTTRSFVSAFAWAAYGFAFLVRPRTRGKYFRLAGSVLLVAGMARILAYPFLHPAQFGRLPVPLSLPELFFVSLAAALAYLTLKGPRAFWGIVLGIFAFSVLNIEVAKYFGGSGRDFTLSTAGSFAQQLAYSFGWLAYAMIILWAGIRLRSVWARYAALALFTLTSMKIFFLDLWRLGALYRVASFVGLAAVLILVSFLYQKFLARKET